MDDLIPQLRAMTPLLIAALLSGAIGWERQARDRPAGLRTHILVGVGSALFVVIGQIFVARADAGGVVQMDPIRITQAIIAGVAFIGAGTVIVRGADRDVIGLTTAASLFAVAGVGIACGLRLFVLATCTTALIFVVLRVLYYLERRIGDD